MEIEVNIGFRNIKIWRDSKNRAEHVIDMSEIANAHTRRVLTQSKQAISEHAQKHAPHFSTGSVFDRMILRGIGKSQILEAVKKGAKRIREDGSIIAEYRWFKIIYREFRTKDFTKIYPITVYEI